MPRAPSGLVERAEPLKAQFMRLELPARCRSSGRKSEMTLALESLEAGGDAYVVPLTGGGDKMTKRVRSAVGNVRKRLGWEITARRTKIGVEPVIAVWRLA